MKMSVSNVRIVTLGVGGLGIILLSAALYLLLSESLWKSATALFFFGLWGLIIGILGLFPAFKNHFHYFLYSTAAGLFLSWGFPPSPLMPLIFLGFVPVFYLEEKRKKNSIGQWPFFFLIYNTFFIWNIWSTYWVANSAFAPAVFAFIVNSLLMALTILWINWIHRKTSLEGYIGVIFIACWVVFEYFHLRWELSWPWLNLGNALAGFPILVQWYEYTGTLGGTFWILMVNYQIYRVFRKNKESFRNISMASILRPGFWLLVPMAISLFLSYNNREETGRSITAVVINPNLEPHYEKFTINQEKQIKLYDRLLKQALSFEPELVVFPETIIDEVNLDNLRLNPVIGHLERILAESGSPAKILMGIEAFRIFPEGQAPRRSTVRESKSREAGRTFQWEIYNSAVLLGNDTIPVYHKRKLVPGAELFPYPKLLIFLKPLVEQLGGTISGFAHPPSQEVFEFDGIRISPIICYESVYGEFLRGYIGEGANLLGVVTNDGWWGSTSGYQQHYLFSGLRAIEYRRDILRSANMGYNGAFDVFGKPVTQPNKYGEEIVLPVTVTLHDKITFYAVWGDYIGRFSLFLLIFITLKAAVNTVLKRST